jgi:hypothetical protein
VPPHRHQELRSRQSCTFMLVNHVDRRQVDTAVVMGAYPPLPEPLVVIIRAAKCIIIQRFMTCGRLYSCDTLLERLAQDLEHMTAKLRQFIQEEDAIVSQRHVARHRHVARPRSAPHLRWYGGGRERGGS